MTFFKKIALFMFFLAAPSVVLCDVYQYIVVPADGGEIETIKLCGWQDDHIVELFVCGEEKTIEVCIRETSVVKYETITAGSLLCIQIPPEFAQSFALVFKGPSECKCLPQILSDIESALKNYHGSEDVQIGVDRPLYERCIERISVDWSGYGVERALPKTAQPQRRGTRSSKAPNAVPAPPPMRGKRARSKPEASERMSAQIMPPPPLVRPRVSSYRADISAEQLESPLFLRPLGSVESPDAHNTAYISDFTPVACAPVTTKSSASIVGPADQRQPKVEGRSADGEG